MKNIETSKLREVLERKKGNGETRVSIEQYEWLLSRLEETEKELSGLKGTKPVEGDSPRPEAPGPMQGSQEKDEVIVQMTNLVKITKELDKEVPHWRHILKDDLDKLREAIDSLPSREEEKESS